MRNPRKFVDPDLPGYGYDTNNHRIAVRMKLSRIVNLLRVIALSHVLIFVWIAAHW